ncbi:thy-1 membrane glycoprotein-like [Corythoichthys intestinalis]|uniref:thy-1 membrane glycoprotein-like n=1 Tax=Corythoichthys intestinalis TaxID=161448 RepID=UPI0025A4D6F6|nr:thy-1 membrane glycoprotein-like [Corythoichthys intestinalis]XP_061801664.1 thy-1 membrane glycoprotein-like [Nerophis lumbriciformis]
MLQHLFLFSVLGVLLRPVWCDSITVCEEDDGDLRVDCLVKAEPNKISSYEFSWSSGSKQALINANVSGLAAEAEFRKVSHVTEVEPHGYRLTLSGYRDKLPHNTTYMCKITGEGASINVERDHLVPCGAVSVLLKRSWIFAMLVFLQLHALT